jgi:O-antigen ligase
MPAGQVIEAESPQVTDVSTRRRLERRLRISLYVTLCTLLMFGPLALGIVQEWSTAVFEIGAAVLWLIWMAWQLAARELRIRRSPLFAPMLVFFGLVLAQNLFHRSAYRCDSLAELWLYFAYATLVFMAVQVVRAGDLLLFAKIMAAFGSMYAIFAVFQGFTGEGRIYWLMKPHVGSVYGAYVNHNHYAGLMELLLPIALVLAFGNAVYGGKRILLIFGATLMAASVFLCQSRGGMFAVIVEMVFLTILWMHQFSPRKSAAMFAGFCLVTALFLAWIAPVQLGSRMTDIHDPARWLIHRDALRMFAAHPFLGSGFGTFTTVFPRYRTFYDGFIINHAHDDYLELLLETGVAGFAMGVWFILVLYREGFRNLKQAKVFPAALIIAAALTGCTGLLAHSFIDFNLHIPANAALFYTLCAIATAPLTSGNQRPSSGNRDRVHAPAGD